jgi:hypothetical protein
MIARMGKRSRLLTTLVSVLALLGQLLLPAAHAQSWARANGDPLLVAFCGQASQAVVEKLRLSAPPELLARLKTDQARLSKASCKLCLSSHGHDLAAVSSIEFRVLRPSPSPDADADLPASPSVRLVLLPPLRAPPAVS